MIKQAFFRFEASPVIGAGHAIRSCVLADALVEHGWKCNIVTTKKSYDFINDLNRFDRIEPEDFYQNPVFCDLLVIDNYDLDLKYEKHFRKFVNKIMVIDDLANRHHDCDVLLDQTYGRDPDDYKNLVPEDCKILAGSDYALLRKEFTLMRPKAIEKRRNTKEIKCILISMGGSCQNEHVIKALEIVKESGFAGNIDVVLGFSQNNLEHIKQYVKTMINKVDFHVNANMAELIYEADLAIGAAGSSVWERCCLGLPSVLIMLVNNQDNSYKSLISNKICYSIECFINNYNNITFSKDTAMIVDGFGTNRTLIEVGIIDGFDLSMSVRTVLPKDKNMLFKWQNINNLRKYCNNPSVPSYQEHSSWFDERVKQIHNPFWIICYLDSAIGVVDLKYNVFNNCFDLGWYIVPEKQGKGLGTKALLLTASLVHPVGIHAFVKKENLSSHKALQKAGFNLIDQKNYFFKKDMLCQ